MSLELALDLELLHAHIVGMGPSSKCPRRTRSGVPSAESLCSFFFTQHHLYSQLKGSIQYGEHARIKGSNIDCPRLRYVLYSPPSDAVPHVYSERVCIVMSP